MNLSDRVIQSVLNEALWLPVSILVAALGASFVFVRDRPDGLESRFIAMALNRFAGMKIGLLAIGHLVAVTLKLALGTLEGSLPVLYFIGLMLAVPSWLLVWISVKFEKLDFQTNSATLVLNIWVALSLLTMGLHNLPLAMPALCNVAYCFHSGRKTGWAIVCLAVLCSFALFAAALVFWASGKTFEEFSDRS